MKFYADYLYYTTTIARCLLAISLESLLCGYLCDDPTPGDIFSEKCYEFDGNFKDLKCTGQQFLY